jgi:hypothetical protein
VIAFVLTLKISHTGGDSPARTLVAFQGRRKLLESGGTGHPVVPAVAGDRAAMIYLHATAERHQEIADTLSAMATAELKQTTKNRSGTQRARKRKTTS